MTRLKFIPRDYQKLIIDHILKHPRCNIYAGMGLGKTVSLLTAYDLLRIAGYETKPMLVIAPLRVAKNVWSDEAAKWEHLKDMKVQPILGDASQRALALRKKADVYTINYDNLVWLMDYLNGTWPFGMVGLDENTKVKGFRTKQGAKRPKALARVAHCKVTRLVGLSGTPAPNGLIDLWGPMWFVDMGVRLGRTFTAYVERWFRSGYDGYSVQPMPHSQDEIEAKIKDVCLSLQAKDYFDLKEPIVNKIYVDLPKDARAKYSDMERDMFMHIEGKDIEAFNAASRTMKCLQLANGAAYTNKEATDYAEVHKEKLHALEEIIEEAAGMPVLVAYHFRSDLERLQRAFPRGRVLDKHPNTIRDWNDGKIPLLFAHPASAGHGLNLQHGGNIIAYFSLNWNLEEHQQILERIGPTRQMQAGLDRPVFVHYILAKDTIDDVVFDRLVSKRSIQDILLDALKKYKESA